MLMLGVVTKKCEIKCNYVLCNLFIYRLIEAEVKAQKTYKQSLVAEYQKAIQIISNKINARKKDQFLFAVFAIVSIMLMSASLVFFSVTVLCVWYSAVHLKNEKKKF
jgi:hypothetical protein